MIMVGKRAADLQRLSGVRPEGRHVLLLPVRRTQQIPAWLTFGGWLAGARNWHFAMMWVLVVNGLVYLGFIYLHGEWRDLVPRRGIVRDAWQMTGFYLAVRRDHPRSGKHNALQRLAYFSMPFVATSRCCRGWRSGSPCSSRRSRAAGRLRLGALLAFPGDAGAGRAHLRSRLHGVRGRSVLAAVDHHGRLRRGEVAGARNARPFVNLRAQRAASRARAARRRRRSCRRRSRRSAPGRAARPRSPRFLAAGGGALGALALAGCDSKGPARRPVLLRRPSAGTSASSARCSATAR